MIVRPNFAGEVPQEDLDYLADLLREEGFEVRVGYGEFPPVPEDGDHANVEVYPWFETVCVWFTQGAITTLGGATALAVVKMLRKRFKKESDEGGLHPGGGTDRGPRRRGSGPPVGGA